MTLITIVHSDKIVLIPLIFKFRNDVRKHILVSDTGRTDLKYAKELETSIGRMNEHYSLPAVEVDTIAVDEDSRRDMSVILKRLESEKGAELYLNAAEADTAMLTIVSGFVLSLGGKVLAYDKYDNSYNVITNEGFFNYPVSDNMKLEDFLILSGEEYIEEMDKEAIRENREALMDIFGDAKRMFAIRKMLSSGNESGVRERYPDLMESLEKLELVSHPRHLKPSRDISLFGTYFEQFVFLHLDRFDFDDIKTGVKIAFERRDGERRDTVVSNEFDILTIKNNRIGIVECKIGDNLNALSTVYKSDALMDYFGDDSRSLIVNIQPDSTPHIAQSRMNFSENITLRAHAKRIEVFNAFDIGITKFSQAVMEVFDVLPRHFLMGGHDLEMISIRQILKRCGQKFTDRHLDWGARVSDYGDILNDEEHFYAIELTEDIQTPKHFTAIDHHNEHQGRPSSIEQTARLLDYPANRLRRLVALNDRGYIPAMKEFGASEKEIEMIRSADRKIQGVTEEDERLAEESVKDLRIVGDICEVYSRTNRFSPVADRLFGKNILVYNDRKLSYYGRDVKKLTEAFDDLIKSQKAYFGGGYGFFGIAEKAFEKKDLEEIRGRILELLLQKGTEG